MTLFPLNRSEHQEQVALFDWRDWVVNQQPDLALLHAIPNGGLRSPATAVRMKREGVLAGIPDVCLPVPRRGYHGFYLEMKRVRGGTIAENQKKIMAALKDRGYRVEVGHGFEQARAAIESYLG